MDLPDKTMVALVRCLSGLQHPAILFQVTINPDRMLPNSNYIRFGGWSGDKGGAGDELTGWMDLNDWELVHVMGTVDANGNLVIGGEK